MPFAPEYIRCALREDFDDAKARVLDPLAPLNPAVAEPTAERPGGPIGVEESRLSAVPGPRHFVEMRRAPGGPAPAATAAALEASRHALSSDPDWVTATRSRMDAAAAERREGSARL